ncbi:sugar ABC transporter substrate-binding protein [Brachybacterium vulturis]|uniref:Sugar ABC transporter substrate-binding protein n=1 Tax=Brachybacterium vulturis TaxID=2017484 RepID=A0A291GJ95_9MICO|nr:extracellular solute-binding protein [Brachybacterium vulturis]ATG50112.1 sugar ABC transporter substrate-binding protein [Brachybacterium vulturis]
MNIDRRTFTTGALAAPLAATTLAACGDGGGGSGGDAVEARGPISVWLSNNEQEVAWGTAMVEAWNADHPDEQVEAQEIPAGQSSEEAITAAITAGTTPDLIFNISTAAAPGWTRQGGLIDLTTFEDGASYIEERSGAEVAQGYADDEGRYYLLPWKSNPVMIMFNKDLFEKAGIDPEDPGMTSHESFLEGARKIVESGAAPAAIWPSPTNEFFQPWFDFYPLYIAETDGMQLVEDGASTFVSEDGLAVANFWASIYSEGLAPKEASTDDAMGTAKTAMQSAGPWAISSYKDAFPVGFMPVPTSAGSDPATVKTFADSKNVSMFTTSQNQATAWDFLKFATSEEQDGAFLEATGQMPLRAGLLETYPDYFEENPDYTVFASQAERVVDVPNIPNSIEVWQTFRDEYSAAVIFAKKPVEDALETAAETIDQLVQG